MAILSGLFGSKKRPKHSPNSSSISNPSPSTPESNPKVQALTPSPTSGPSRFASVRRKSSAVAVQAVRRQSSGDINGKKQISTGGKANEWELPTLGFRGVGDEKGLGESGLGWESVGRLPRLGMEEVERLDKASFGVGEVMMIWKVLGMVLKDTDQPTCILESTGKGDTELDKETLTLRPLTLITVQPSAISDFPSLSSHYPSPSSSSSAESPTWSDRLSELARSVPPQTVASTLKWTLRHLLSPSHISSETYIKFVQAEHAASYTPDAYSRIFTPMVSREYKELLHELFDVWAALASHAEDQSGLGGRMSLLMGWWILQPSQLSENVTWEEMYASWRLAARRIEHLFLAWIRDQSTTHNLPTRLVALVAKYPFGPSEYSAETLPPPPPSSFTRRTLHLSLHTDQSLAESPIAPSDILSALRLAQPHKEVGLSTWDSLKPVITGNQSTDQLAEPANLLAQSPGTREGTPISPLRDSPHNPLGSLPLSSQQSNIKLLDSLAEEVAQLAKSHTPVSLPRQPSLGKLRLPESTSSWDDFTKSGFGKDKDANLNLALSPSASINTFTSVLRDSPIKSNDRPALATPKSSPPLKISFVPTAKYTIAGEEIVDVDDIFMTFTEEGQMDIASSAKWPAFTLIRLENPHQLSDDTSPIERLLITVEYRAPTPPVSITPTPKTLNSAQSTPPPSTSPNGESSFRFGSFGFKRSTSRPGFRSTLFGSSRSLNKDGAGSDFITGGETIYKNGATGSAHLGPGASVDELGQLTSRDPVSPTLSTGISPESKKGRKAVPALLPPTVSLPHSSSLAEVAQMAQSSPVSESVPAPKAVSPVDTPKPPVALPISGPSSETSPNDWSYGAEGGAHVVFTYAGEEKSYTGKLLRVRKISNHRDDPLRATSEVWREQILPSLVPEHLLLHANSIKMDKDWLKVLLGRSENDRPEDRKSSGDLIKEVGDEPRISIMENLRMAEKQAEGTKVLAVEIKPKWGFLPSASSIQPPEAAEIKSKIGRYTLHQHYRGKTVKENGYDPLDLFSDDEKMISQALAGLWGIWRDEGGQANSFRVFVDGNVVHPDEADTEGSLLKMTSPILIPLLQSSKALPTLKHLQSTLDPTDISDLVTRFKSAHPNIPIFDESVTPDIQSSELSTFIEKYLSSPSAGHNDGEWTLRERIIAYSLSAIFKDCSIIIRAVLVPDSEDGGWKVEKEGSTVKLLDLDLKPLKMRHWAELDEKIWKHWYETKGGGSRDVEDVRDQAAKVPKGQTESTSEAQEDQVSEKTAVTSSVEVAPLAGWFPFPPVETPAVGSERNVPGGFPGIPAVNPATPGILGGPDLTRNDLQDGRKGDDSNISHTEGAMAGDAEEEVERGEEILGPETGNSSIASTPMFPGAFKFPEVPIRQESLPQPAMEELSAKTSTLEITSESIPDVITPITNDHPQSTLQPIPAEPTVDLRADSPAESRFQRSSAPSPSPLLSPSTLEPITTEISLSSPTFGQIKPIDTETESLESPQTGSTGLEDLSMARERSRLSVTSISDTLQHISITSSPSQGAVRTIDLSDIAPGPSIPPRHSSFSLGKPIEASPRSRTVSAETQRPRHTSNGSNGPSSPSRPSPSPSSPSRPPRRRVDSSGSRKSEKGVGAAEDGQNLTTYAALAKEVAI